MGAGSQGVALSMKYPTSDTRTLLAAVRTAGAPWGLDLVGAVDARAYDATAPVGHRLSDVFPGVRGAVIVGNAGPAFWERFRERISHAPALARRSHPLDAHTVEVMEPLRALFRERGLAERTVFPFYGARDHALSFRRLAMAAGFGVDSVLDLVLHPQFGPWIATRAAVLTDVLLVASGPIEGFDPCTRCPAPCIAACPGGAFPERRWSALLCLEAKQTLTPCLNTCLSRTHCVIGAAHRYPDDAMAYHSTLPRGICADSATATRPGGD
jgi:epoxyqueuosine reductase QueG